MQANYVQRLRGTFGKAGPARFISHLDLVRTIERALIRAQIPLAYSQGFNPQPRMQFAAALPLGFTSDGEIVDLFLSESIDPEATLQNLNKKMAPGIVMHTLIEQKLSSPKLQTITSQACYVATFTTDKTAREMKKAVDKVLSSKELIRTRRDREYDLRPLIIELEVEEIQADDIQLSILMTHLPGISGRPDEVLKELGFDPLAARIHRRELILSEPSSEDH
jgi:radical SAM-linked protein